MNEIKIVEKGETKYILDIVRKKYLVLTPEEWVRQHIILFLIEQKHFPKNLIRVEQKLEGKDMFFRADIVVYDKNGKARMIIECKAENVKITQDVFEQISKYNLQFQVDYLMITNGKQNFVCKIDYENKNFSFLKTIPEYSEIVSSK
jgi:predicted type IV restriction endonuclease